MEISYYAKNLKKRFATILVLSFFICVIARGQELRVIDSVSHKPLQAATVMIMSESTKSVIKQGLTDESGALSFPVQDTARLLISVFEVGYKKITVTHSKKIDTVWLQRDQLQLNEVVVRGARNSVKFAGGTLSYDIAQIRHAENMNLKEIIDQLPFLQVTSDNAIKLMNETLRILINGRSNILYNNAEDLKNIPPQAIENIEVSSAPMARNNIKTINIILKHDYFLGWNGSVNLAGTVYSFAPGATLSYWRNKFGIDVAFNTSGGDFRSTRKTDITYTDLARQVSTDEHTSSRTGSTNTYLSAYWNFDRQNSIDFQYALAPHHLNSLTTYDISTQAQNDEMSSLGNRQSVIANTFSLNYTHQSKKPGDAFYVLTYSTFSIDKTNQQLDGASMQTVTDGVYDQHTNYKEFTTEIVDQHNSSKQFKYTFGSKLIYRTNLNTAQVDTNAVFTSLSTNIKELVSSTYGDFNWATKKVSTHFGLRYDYTSNKFEPQHFTNDFSDLIPLLSVTYNISSANLLSATYTRSLYRPGFNYLTPVSTPTSAYQISRGNENITNQINNSYGLQYFLNLSTVHVGVNFNYNHINGAIGSLSVLDTSGVISNVSYNTNSNNSYSLGLSIDVTLFKKLRLSHFSSGSYTNQKSDGYFNSGYGGYLSDRLIYFLSKNATIAANILGHTPNINLQGKEQAQAYLTDNISYTYFFTYKKVYPITVSLTLSNPEYWSGLPGYLTTETSQFTLRSTINRRNPVVSASVRIQFLGKKLGNRTFNKEKVIQNSDLNN